MSVGPDPVRLIVMARTNRRDPSADYHRQREREHEHRRRVSTVAAIEREIVSVGLGPVQRVENGLLLELRDAAGELVATVGEWPSARYSSTSTTWEARDATGRTWFSGELWKRAALRRAG